MHSRGFLSICFAALVSLSLMAPLSAETVKKGIRYAPSGERLDLCMPQKGARNTGLIFIHGGGFAKGNRAQMLGFCKLLARGGFPSVTVSYRLTANGHSYPAALNDIEAAVGWMRRNRGNLGIDPGKIVVIGYSAGGTLALSAGLKDRLRLAGIVSVAGISDFDMARRDTPHRQIKRDIDAYLGKVQAAQASPLSAVSKGDPPVLLFHGKRDKLVPIAQSVVLAQRLKAARVKTLFRVFDTGGHGIMLPGRHLKPLLQDLTKFLLAIDAS